MRKAFSVKNTQLSAPEIMHESHEITPFDLRLVTKKIKIKFSAYKISTQLKNMSHSESIAISQKGLLFSAESFYEKGTLLRVWVEIPDYWSRKSKHVDYRHTEAPTHFQMLSRVVRSEEQFGQTLQYHILCENLNIDSVDECVLQDYLASAAIGAT
ncbi:MAG: hypothetical protein V4591_12010 [Bdellovibrionota bacterium]